MPSLPVDAGLGTAAVDKDDSLSQSVPVPQVHTPPTTDEASHKDDDAASSSSLSDLGDDIEDEENRMRFEEAARAGAEAEQFSEVKPDRYENGVPIFTPTMEQFKDFNRYVKGVDPYGMQSGIVLIDPPEEWKQARKALDDLVKTIKIKNPLTQEFHGAQGVYTQRNMEKMRSYNLPQWKALCEQTENQPPARRGEKRLNADRLLGRGTTKSRKSEASPIPETGRRSVGRPRTRPIKEEASDHGSTLLAPPTPTSPEVKPATLEHGNGDDAVHETPEPTPTKEKRGRKPGRSRGRQPKAAVRRETGGAAAETTVAARRLRNAREANDDIDQEAFEDFDYRVYDNEQWTAERCEELEDKYWKSLNFSNPMYAADMPGSLFDADTQAWNVAHLPNLLDLLGDKIPGVNTAYLYLGMWRATFAWHLEDVDLYSINYIHFGAPKQWYSVSQKDAPKFEAAMKSIWGSDAKNCDQFLRHKTYLVSPAILKSKFGVTVNKVVHREGQFVITFPIGYHSGYNLGYNCAESVNFAIENWLQYGKTARKCQCEADSVFIDVDWFVRKMNGEPTPEYEEVEVTDDEDELEEPIDFPTPPSSDRGKVKGAQKRKRPPKELGPNKKAKKIIKVRKVSKNQPCCLCPNDFAWEELLPTTQGQKAHRTCAMYTPETYIANSDGKEMVHNIENISKARLELKCYECRQKKGSCFQCSSAKCTKAYHATCAMQAGVQVDKGPIAVWHEGVEYRDIGFDWRCRLHRTVKRTRITSELSACNHANSCWRNKEFREFLFSLKPGALVQFQATNADDIEAGLVVARYDEGQDSLLVKIIPDMKTIREVDPTTILFVDSATSCLQNPSANALELPEELQGKTASLPESTEKKPSAGDPFTEEPPTEWAEFASTVPPVNAAQKPVNFLQEKQMWLYIGETSSEAKAHYTADPGKRIHDSASNFLETVTPPKPVMPPPPQPKRHSLAASYPMLNVAARNAATVNMRQQHAVSQNQNGSSLPGTFNGTTHDLTKNTSLEKFANLQKPAQIKNSQYRDMIAGQEARINEQTRILQRQAAKAQQLDAADRASALSHTGIGIDHDAVQRQRQFQSQASQHAKHMTEWSNDPSLPPLKQYNEPFPSFQNGDSASRYGGNSIMNSRMRPQQYNYSNDWMNPSLANGGPSFASPQNSGMNSMLPVFGPQPSPSAANPTFPSYVQQSHMQFPYQNNGMNSSGRGGSTSTYPSHGSSLDNIRAAASQPPAPPPSAEVERQRRISNPAYPFKSPDQIKAQKEAGKNTPPGSRPTSSYTMPPSPRVQHDFSLQTSAAASPIQPLDPHNPPQFINPNATQISPPGSSAGHRSARGSFSGLGLHSSMAPPLQSGLRRSQSMSMAMDMDLDLAPFPANSIPLANYIPKRSMYDPLNSGANPFNQQKQSQVVEPPMAQPSHSLTRSLEKRPLGSNGLMLNDRPAPKQLVDWQERGGFWGRVSRYYINKHQIATTVYKSPFVSTGVFGQPTATLAERYYQNLEPDQKGKIDEARTVPMEQ
ncbi:uncharacterized protein A1O9_01422 [Exophiala aquamarina CBS 119918]|uniref:[histone H3]-trimethyl-L-lysine(9) demethylase n=1 Tax=Exophiala aquamarina CBS 119918 TaxID=1182545 RepID=A0A072PTL4_9EURO|nr:uncharacterized protein A1O9_01422 [Exophiala aquamarina CBS 119918]KEF63444.1 hypothetical protein A1O9_01422 [Exophiala aquamarina CBS 119918]